MKEPTINVTVKTVPHPNSAQAVDVFARMIVKDLLRQEKGASPNG